MPLLPVPLRLLVLAALPAAGPASAAAPGGELVLHKWSGTINVPDPVACTVDPAGRVYVTATTRRKAADLDIREHSQWIPDDVGLDSIDAKREFLRRELAPGRLRGPRGMLRDHNGDGSVDWQDLTHPTERIYQLRDTDGDGTADRITVFAEGFNTVVTGIAAGVLWHDGWVYATIAPDLWRFRDTDDDGVADVREVLVSGFGVHIAYAGHDMHGLTVGPDGRLYWTIGDKGGDVVSREGRRYSFPNEGATLRMELDGSGFEVFTRGNRNIQEPAFNDLGDLLGVDNDADLPGERERFVHLVEGSDSGWRCNYQYQGAASPWMREGLWKPAFPGQAAYLLPPLANYSDGPAGFKVNPGTALGAAQAGLFLLNEFPSGKLRAFHAEPAGATYRMTGARVLHEGVMGIGLSWHPDGSLLLADWIGGYPLDGLGAVWRVDVPAEDRHSGRAAVLALLAEGFGARSPLELAGLLAHPDQRVRLGAQLELAGRNRPGELLALARAARGAPLARLHGLWGYGQLLRRGTADPGPVAALLQDADAEVRAQAAKVLGDAAAAGAKGLSAALLPVLADPAPRARLQAALALGKTRDAAAVGPLFAFAEVAGADAVLRHAAVAGLAGCADRAELAARLLHPAPSVRLAAVVALRRQRDPAVADFLGDRDPLVVAEAARAIYDNASIPEALPRLAARLGPDLGEESALRRALHANLRVGTSAAAARLLDFALQTSVPEAARAEALEALRLWAAPPRLDPVDGWARAFRPESAAAQVAARLDALLGVVNPGLRARAVEVILAHGVKPGVARVAAMVAEVGAAPDLRARALRLLATEGSPGPEGRRALDLALAAGSPAPLFRAALDLLPALAPEQLVPAARAAWGTRSVPERQHAVAALAAAATPAADALLAEWSAALPAGGDEPALRLDLLEALGQRAAASPALAARVNAYAAGPAAAARRELLAGGDVARGRALVTGHLAANCTACHSVDSSGGSVVGPALRAIGAQRDPDYLLESLLQPSAQIAPGYAIVQVTLRDGSEVTGTLAAETAGAVTIRLFDGRRRVLARAEIAAQTPPASVMPSMEGILSPRELRDVVAYLASLQGGRSPRAARGAAK